MKITDDYKAKIRLWVTNPRVVDCPVPEGLPHFGHQSFDSLDEMNAWKRSYRAEIAKLGGVTWKS